MDWLMGGWIDFWMDGEMNGWMVGLIDCKIDACMVNQNGKYINRQIRLMWEKRFVVE